MGAETAVKALSELITYPCQMDTEGIDNKWERDMTETYW